MQRLPPPVHPRVRQLGVRRGSTRLGSPADDQRRRHPRHRAHLVLERQHDPQNPAGGGHVIGRARVYPDMEMCRKMTDRAELGYQCRHRMSGIR